MAAICIAYFRGLKKKLRSDEWSSDLRSTFNHQQANDTNNRSFATDRNGSLQQI